MKIFDCLKEFRESYNDYPSQDNEWYVPERGSFKSGFYACYRKLNPLFMETQTELEHLKLECSGMGKLISSGIVIKTEEYQSILKVIAAARNILDMYDEVHWRDPERDIQNALKELDKFKK